MEYSFHNLVDLKKIQQLLEIFSNLAGVSVALIEPDATFMPEKGWQKICSQFHQKHSVSAELCRYSNKMLRTFEREEKYNIATCPNGLIHAAAPVVIQGETVATVIASQFLTAPPDMSWFSRMAREYKFDEEEYLQTVKEIPVISEEHAIRITEFLKLFATLLAEMGLEKLDQLQSYKQQLHESEQHLQFISKQMPGLVWATDTDLRYTFNTRGTTSDNSPAENWTGRTIYEKLDTNDPNNSIISMHLEALTGKTINFEMNYNGQLWETHIEPLLNAKNEIIGTLGIGLDITERRQMELALQESERTYRELFDNAAILLFTIDLEGKFTSANKYALLHFGYEHEDLLSGSIFDIILPEYADYVRSKINEKLEGADITTYITEILDGHGVKKTVELHTRLIYDGEHPIGVQGAGRDITEQKRTQQALEASEQKFRTLAEDSTAIVYILKGNRFVYVNPALIKLTAFTEEELLNMNFWDVVHPDFRDLARERGLARQQGINVPATYELKLLSKRQESVWIYLTGSQIVYEGEEAVMASAIDITELKRGQEALQESQTLLNHIIDFLPDATLVINSAGKILSWNRAMEKLTGINAGKMLGKSNYEYALPFYGERRPILIDMVFEPDEVIQQRYSYINRVDENIAVETFIPDFRPGGAYLWGFATPLVNASGEVIGAIETIRDVTERRQMENEVINQAEFLRITLEQSPTGTAIVDKEQNFVFLNSRITEITGYTLKDIPSMEKWEQKAYPNDTSRKILHDNWQKQFELKNRAKGTARVHCKNGQIKDVEFHGIKLPDQRTIISIWDVTWQKQVEENLRAGEARFKALSDASFEGIILTENGICIDVNQKAADMFGYDYGEMIGMDAGDFAVPESRTEVLNNIANQYELPYEGSALRRDGSSLPVEVQGRVFDYQGRRIRAAAIRDLSERRQAEAELLRQRQNLQALFYNSPDALALLNLKQEILEVNPQFISLFGYKAEECRHKQLNDLVVPQEYLEEYKKHSQLVSMGESVNMETIRKNKSGQVFDVMMKTVPITNAGLYVMYSDISERKKSEQIINEQVKELEAKNAEMERFTYTVSHDLRSPLITIKGFAGLLIEDLTHGNHHRLEKDLQRIINAADKMDDLLRDLLELSRVGRMLNAFTKFSMTRLANEAAELIRGRLKERGVILVINPDMPEVNADLIRIREVMQNLLENAIKFMGNQTEPRIEIGFTDSLKEWTFFIRDNGIGIESRYHNSIFGLFNKLDPNCEGTGIGLSLVKRIIEFHNGKIWVDSTGTGQGSTFYFTLPKQ